MPTLRHDNGKCLDVYGENVYVATTIYERSDIETLFTGLDEKATIYIKNKIKLNKMLSGVQIDALGLLANVELDEKRISDNAGNVKQKYSAEDTDSEGNELSEGQQKYFKDSKVGIEAYERQTDGLPRA